MTSKGTEIKRYRLTLFVNAGTVLETVFQYLNGNSHSLTAREGKPRAADAVRAFWHPFALEAMGSKPMLVKKAARQSVEALQRQILLICETYELEVPQFSGSGYAASMLSLHNELSVLASTLMQKLSVEPIAETASINVPVESRPAFSSQANSFQPASTREEMDIDDRELLGGLLDL